jgi:hypothetical protein
MTVRVALWSKLLVRPAVTEATGGLSSVGNGQEIVAFQ